MRGSGPLSTGRPASLPGPACTPYDALDHHTTKLGVVLPVALLRALVGTHPLAYYVAPLTISILIAVLVFEHGRSLLGRRAAWLAIALLLLPPAGIRMASQVTPSTFSAFYLLACAYVLARWPTRRLAVVLAATLFFLAYLSKVPNLLFFPGILAALWFVTRDWRTCVIFAGTCLALFAVETLAYRQLGHLPYGRASVIMSHHLGSGKLQPIQAWELLRRFEGWDVLALYGGGVAAIVYLRSTRALTSSMLVIALPFLSFAVLVTFTVKSVDPLIPAMPFRVRYLDVGAPFAALVVAMACESTLERLRAHPRAASLREMLGWVPYALVSVLMFSAFLFLLLNPRYSPHPVFQLVEQDRIVDDAMERRLPVVAPPNKTGIKILFVVATLYVDDDLVVAAHRASPSVVGGPTRYKDLHGLRPRTLELDGRRLHLMDPSFTAAEVGPGEFTEAHSAVLLAESARPVQLRVHPTTDLALRAEDWGD